MSVLQGFQEFVMRGNVIDLAVGVIIGAAFKQVVDMFVEGVVNPGIAAAVGKPDFDELTVGPIHYGKVLTAIVNFLLTAAVLYFCLVLPMNKFSEAREARAAADAEAAAAAEVAAVEEAPADEITAEQQLLTEIRDLLLRQNESLITEPVHSP